MGDPRRRRRQRGRTTQPTRVNPPGVQLWPMHENGPTMSEAVYAKGRGWGAVGLVRTFDVDTALDVALADAHDELVRQLRNRRRSGVWWNVVEPDKVWEWVPAAVERNVLTADAASELLDLVPVPRVVVAWAYSATL